MNSFLKNKEAMLSWTISSMQEKTNKNFSQSMIVFFCLCFQFCVRTICCKMNITSYDRKKKLNFKYSNRKKIYTQILLLHNEYVGCVSYV